MRAWSSSLLVLALLGAVSQTDGFCPARCLCDDETLQVTCDGVGLEVVPITLNPSVRRLVLKRSKIKSIDTALRFYSDLLYVDFSHSILVDIKDKSFDTQKKLTELRLGYNKISSVTNGTWLGLHSLKILSLRQNYLGNLGERAFATAGQLLELDLGENGIEHIHPEAFAGLPDLRILYLDNNKLGDRDPSWPFFMGSLTQLAELSLAGNDLPWLAEGLFGSLNELVQLDLSHCKIRNVSASAFRGLDQLRGLKLHSNLLSAVPTHAWAVLAHLETLTLGQNNLTRLESAAFAGLGRLKMLDIHDVPQLVEVHPAALSGNRDLVQLRLTGCKRLAGLPEGFFSHTVSLRRLSLRDNGLVTLPDKVFHPQGSVSQSIQTLDLSGNPFRCDCQLQWLRDYLLRGSVMPSGNSSPARMRRTVVTTVSSPSSTVEEDAASVFDAEAALELVHSEPPPIICSSPLSVAERTLQSLSDDQLGCRTSLFGNSSPSLIIGLSIAGGVAILLCTAFLICRYRRRMGRSCCRPSDAKPHPKCSEDSRTLASKWKPASPNTWGAAINGNHHHHHHHHHPHHYHSGSSSSSPAGMYHQQYQHQQQTVSLIGGSRNPEYHKACTNEEECFMRAVTLHNSLKPFPRTEL